MKTEFEGTADMSIQVLAYSKEKATATVSLSFEGFSLGVREVDDALLMALICRGEEPETLVGKVFEVLVRYDA